MSVSSYTNVTPQFIADLNANFSSLASGINAISSGGSISGGTVSASTITGGVVTGATFSANTVSGSETIASGATLTIASGGSSTVAVGGTDTVSGTWTVASGGSAVIASGGKEVIASGGALVISSGGSETISAGATLTVSGTLNVPGIANLSGGAGPILMSGVNAFVYQIASAGMSAFSGGGQTSATALINAFNAITTVSAAGDSVKLGAALGDATGVMQIIMNTHATNSVSVFPPSGQSINASATNSSVALAAGKTAIFACPTSGKWYGGTLT